MKMNLADIVTEANDTRQSITQLLCSDVGEAHYMFVHHMTGVKNLTEQQFEEHRRRFLAALQEALEDVASESWTSILERKVAMLEE